MAEPWRVAGVQMDIGLGTKSANLARMLSYLRVAADQGAQLVVFPECALSGYGFASKAEAWPHAETIPGPATQALAEVCAERDLFCVFGLLEAAGDDLFNAAALVGPTGLLGSYRKVHLPYLGVDRFATPGNRPFAVHDLGDFRVGLLICFDGSIPEAARVLALLGADLIVLPTNWPTGAACSSAHVPPMRALENHVYFLAVNRVGQESGFDFPGGSRLVDYQGTTLAGIAGAEAGCFIGTITPQAARQKRVVNIPGHYELDRLATRRPEFYGLLAERGP